MIDGARGIEAALRAIRGDGVAITRRRRASGGDINDAAILELSSGSPLFIKENRASLESMFAAEARGLEALGAVSGGPPVPRPLATGTEGPHSFLIMELIETGPSAAGTGAAFGRALAALHREGRADNCGFHEDNWIGSTPQPNGNAGSWIDFFSRRRIGYQWELAQSRGYGDRETGKSFERLMEKIGDILPDVDDGKPSLLHGDLWGGNWLAGADGRAWLIDPAVYYGHREADLAMTELFGGFPAGFRESYREAWPLEPGYEGRRDLYNLYHLLNHLNLFGSGYLGQVQAVIRRYV